MADYTEKLARDIRKELGEYDDPDQPVVLLVRNLRTRIAELENPWHYISEEGLPTENERECLVHFRFIADKNEKWRRGILELRCYFYLDPPRFTYLEDYSDDEIEPFAYMFIPERKGPLWGPDWPPLLDNSEEE